MSVVHVVVMGEAKAGQHRLILVRDRYDNPLPNAGGLGEGATIVYMFEYVKEEDGAVAPRRLWEMVGRADGKREAGIVLFRAGDERPLRVYPCHFVATAGKVVGVAPHGAADVQHRAPGVSVKECCFLGIERFVRDTPTEVLPIFYVRTHQEIIIIRSMWKKLTPGHLWRFGRYVLVQRLYPAIYPLFTRVWARFRHEHVILVVGDSHSQAYTLQYPFIVYHVGAATAYNLSTPRSSTQSAQKLMHVVREMDTRHEQILLTFGEIDCRIHIYNTYRKLGGRRSILSLIKVTVERYGRVMKQLRDDGVPFFVLSVTPAGHQGNIYHYPSYASFSQRARIARQFNRELKRYCQRYNFAYIDLYQSVVDTRGGVQKKYRKDQVHLNAAVAPLTRELILRSVG